MPKKITTPYSGTRNKAALPQDIITIFGVRFDM